MNETDTKVPVEQVLKACPFCGEQPLFTADDSYGGCHVHCGSCDAEPCCSAPKDTPEKAIAAWNTRSSAPVGREPSDAMIERLILAIEPLAGLAGDVNMNDPLGKWFTVAQLVEARDAMNAATTHPSETDALEVERERAFREARLCDGDHAETCFNAGWDAALSSGHRAEGAGG